MATQGGRPFLFLPLASPSDVVWVRVEVSWMQISPSLLGKDCNGRAMMKSSRLQCY